MNSKLFLFFLLAILAAGCTNDEQGLGEVVTVKLAPSFLSLEDNSDVQMRSLSTLSDTSAIYAIQIYENDVPYYYGLFNDVTQMEIALKTSNTYKFKVSAFKKGTGKGLKTESDLSGNYYFLPNKVLLENKFVKGNALIDIDLPTSVIINGQQKDFTEIDGFYSTKTVLIEKGMTSIDFSLLRMGFGINFNVDALTSGNLEIYLGNDTIKLNSLASTASTVRLFNSSSFNTIQSNSVSYADSILIKVKWTGTSSTSISSQEKYLFFRNYKKNITIHLNTTTSSMNFEAWGISASDTAVNTVTDIDGNIYKTVTIGTQTWMAENLKVTHYRDGSAIPLVTSSSTWASLTTGAYCDYNNLQSNSTIYGRLYNWYTISDSRNVAPVGWHVPSDDEWTTLSNYLGGELVAGGKLKETGTSHWLSPNTGASNSAGFSALGGGYFQTSVTRFVGLREYGRWWTSTAISNTNVWDRNINFYYNNLFRDSGGKLKNEVFSIRCIKD